MATLGTTTGINGSALGSQLTDLLMAPDIQPGSTPSYQLCKLIYELHPIGKKMVDAPIAMAQSQNRDIVVTGPDMVREAFEDEWNRLRATKVAAQTMRVARIYGTSALTAIQPGVDPLIPLDFKNLWQKPLGLNVLDPLNTAGTQNNTMALDPNAMGFQNAGDVVSNGKSYHPSRTCVLYNEAPLYISYTSSAFGFVGRSVYQRALFPLKTFVQSMRTDDLVVRKVGVVVAKIKQVGSMVDNVMAAVTGGKRALAKEAITEDVLSIGNEDSIESMNLGNLEGPYKLARQNMIENTALAADMPAKILNSETFAEGFGEGTEDAKNVARFVDGIRIDGDPVYSFLDKIVQYRAWTPDFFANVQQKFPEQYAGMRFEDAFYEWQNSFRASWPSLLTEPDSEKIKVDDVRIKAVIAIVQVLLPVIDPENKAALVTWLCDSLSEMKLLSPVPLVLDAEALAAYEPPQPTAAPGEPEENKPFSAADAADVPGVLAHLAPRKRA